MLRASLRSPKENDRRIVLIEAPSASLSLGVSAHPGLDEPPSPPAKQSFSGPTPSLRIQAPCFKPKCICHVEVEHE